MQTSWDNAIPKKSITCYILPRLGSHMDSAIQNSGDVIEADMVKMGLLIKLNQVP